MAELVAPAGQVAKQWGTPWWRCRRCISAIRRSAPSRHRAPGRRPGLRGRGPRRPAPARLFRVVEREEGVQPLADESYYVGFETAGQHIGLLPGGGPQGTTSPVPYWHVSDIEAKLAEVTAAGATVKEPARNVSGTRWVATFTDPDGNVLGLLEDR